MTGRLPNVAEAIFRLTRRGWASIQSALNAVENLWVKIGRAAQKILSRAHGRTVRRTAFYMLDGAPDSCSASTGSIRVSGGVRRKKFSSHRLGAHSSDFLSRFNNSARRANHPK